MTRIPPLFIAWMLVVFFATTSAHAQTNGQQPVAVGSEEIDPALRLPIAAAERPLTLPRLILRPTLQIDDTHESGGLSYPNFTLGAALGITDYFVVRATVLPLQLNPVHYGELSEYVGPSAGATLRFLKGVVEMGLSVDAGPYTLTNTSGAVVEPSISAYIHVSKKTRIATGLDLTIRDYKEENVGIVSAPGIISTPVNSSLVSETFQIPVTLLYNLVDTFYLSASSGFEHVFRSTDQLTRIPLGIAAGYTIAGKQGPLLQLEPFFTFFSIFTPGASPTTETANWRLGLNVDGYFYL
jgi:hypothetical protein